MDSKHQYSSHFPSSNKGAWQENQMLSPSTPPAPNSEHKQIDNAENTATTTTTPACDVNIIN